MNIYEKIVATKTTLHETYLKKSGFNDFGKWKYFELADFLPTIINCQAKFMYMTMIHFDADMAYLYAVDIEKPDEKVMLASSPTARADTKGNNALQNIGSTHTYMRRYLYINAFDVIQSDDIDSLDNRDEKELNKTATEKSKNTAKSTPAPVYNDRISAEQANKIYAFGKTENDKSFIRSIVKSFGVEKVAELKASQFDEFMALLDGPNKLPFAP